MSRRHGLLMRACARVQSARQATACRLLPPVHWALLYTIGALFVSTFILFETGGSFSNEGRHILFTVLCGLMSFVLVVSLCLSVLDSVIYCGDQMSRLQLTALSCVVCGS